MRLYYVVLDFAGWEVFRTLEGEGVTEAFLSPYEFQFVTTCKDNAVKVAAILQKRMMAEDSRYENRF